MIKSQPAGQFGQETRLYRKFIHIEQLWGSWDAKFKKRQPHMLLCFFEVRWAVLYHQEKENWWNEWAGDKTRIDYATLAFSAKW